MDFMQRREDRQRRRKRKWIYAVLSVMLIIVLFFGVSIIKDYTGVDIKSSVTIQIKQGMGGAAIAQTLKDNQVIKYTMLFKMKAKSGGYSQKFQPGTVVIEPGTSYAAILDMLTKSNRNTVKVVIPEGYEVRQIADTLEQAGVIDREKFMAELDPDKYDYKFLKDLPDRENPLEGYLFPDTYQIADTDTEHDIIDMMLSAFNKQFQEAYYARASELDMSVDQIVTLASVIERETSSDKERAKVAGVFYNRLHQNMKLQSCATVQYILKERKTNLSTADTRIQSPYNTYVNAGLPVGPIASPGIECIQAALYPETTDALFFVLGKDGNHIFSKTYADHLKAKKEAGL